LDVFRGFVLNVGFMASAWSRNVTPDRLVCTCLFQ